MEWLLRKRLAKRMGSPKEKECKCNLFKMNIESHMILGNTVTQFLCLTGFHPTTVKFSLCYILTNCCVSIIADLFICVYVLLSSRRDEIPNDDRRYTGKYMLRYRTVPNIIFSKRTTIN
jgi:hypothetical protein